MAACGPPLTSERKSEIDTIIQRLPLFVPHYDNDLCELRVRPKEVFEHYHYAQKNDHEFDYWSDQFAKQLRVIHLKNLIQWLRDRGVPEDVISQLPKEKTPCPRKKEDEVHELAMWKALGAQTI